MGNMAAWMQVLAGFGVGKSCAGAREIKKWIMVGSIWVYLFIHFIHSGKVAHVLEVHVNLDDLLPRRSGCFQDLAEVGDTLCLRPY
jgi:hypothetical protein